MLLRLLTFPLTAPVGGLMWMGEQILERANTELDEKENLNKRLLALQLSYDMGDISEEEFEEREEALLMAIQEMQAEERETE